ncbi:hypothetical protein ScPMuIL_008398 [Solemya velum]
MGRCRSYCVNKWLLIAPLLILVLCCNSKSLHKEKEEKKGQWLEDVEYYTDYMENDMNDQLVFDTNNVLELCPPVPDNSSLEACTKTECVTDKDCSKSQKCCYNGCVFTCLTEVQKPAFIDWLRQPKRINKSEPQWLILGSSGGKDAEVCSTSPVSKDEDPLLCPHGYVCHIVATGDIKKRIPNHGYCVPTTAINLPDVGSDGRKSDKPPTRYCYVDNYIVENGAEIRVKRAKCRCKKGFLSCRRRHKKASG